MRRSAPVVICAVVTAVLLSGNPLPSGRPSFGPAVSLAQEEWKAEYESVCSKTDMAMTLSVGELKDLVARCVQLEKRIEEQEESTRKVYMRRLRMCNDLYKFVLEYKERDR